LLKWLLKLLKRKQPEKELDKDNEEALKETLATWNVQCAQPGAKPDVDRVIVVPEKWIPDILSPPFSKALIANFIASVHLKDEVLLVANLARRIETLRKANRLSQP